MAPLTGGDLACVMVEEESPSSRSKRAEVLPGTNQVNDQFDWCARKQSAKNNCSTISGDQACSSISVDRSAKHLKLYPENN